MVTQTQQHELRTLVESALTERDAAERYAQRQRELRRGRTTTEGHPRPLEFDESGFPIPQPPPGLVQRIGRLMNGDRYDSPPNQH